MQLYFWLSTALLAALLFLPLSRLIFVLSVRRLQVRLGRGLQEAEMRGQLARARFLAVLLASAFATLFNGNLLGWPGHG